MHAIGMLVVFGRARAWRVPLLARVTVLMAVACVVALGGAGSASAQTLTPPWVPAPSAPYEIVGQPGAPAITFNGTHTLLAVPDSAGFVYMASLAADGSFTVVPFDVGGDLRSVSFSTDGKLLAVSEGFFPGSVVVFSVGEGGELTNRRSFPVGDDPVSVAFGPDGQFVAVLERAFGGGVSTYSVATGALISHLPLPSEQLDANNLTINSNGTLLALASGTDPGKVTTISVKPEGHLSENPPAPGHTNSWSAFNPGGNLLAIGHLGSIGVSLFDVKNDLPHEVPNSPFLPTKASTSVAFSPDGLFLAAANYYEEFGTISLFSVGPAELTYRPEYTINTIEDPRCRFEGAGSPSITCDPYYVLFDPNRHFLVVVYSSSFYGFSIYPRTGPLEIGKTAQPRVVTQGGILRYRLTVHNPSAHPVTATVTDELSDVLRQATYRHDARATIGTAAVDTGTSPPRLTWRGTLGAGQTAIIRYSVRIDANASGFATNRVDGPPNATCLPPPATELPCETETPIVPPPGPGADLSVTKTASTHTTHPGDQVLFTLVVHNNGPLDATGVTLSDPVPAGLFFHTSKPTQGTCTLTAPDLTCQLGRIVSGGSAEVLVEATVATDARGTITNMANVHGRQHDPHLDNNTNSSKITVTPWTEPETTANLVVAKHGPAAVTQGRRFHYTITVTNHGPDSARDVMLIDSARLPLRVVSIHPSQGHCQTGPPIECELGMLHNGAHAMITVTVIATHAGHQVNAAVVMSPDWDPGPGDNVADAETTIRPPPAPTPPPFTG